MGNVAEYCGNDRIEVEISRNQSIPWTKHFPKKGKEPVELFGGQKTVINFDDNNILFRPENNKIINNVQNLKPVHIDQIARQVQIVDSIKNEGQKMKSIHYIMKANQLTEQQIKQQTREVQEFIATRPHDPTVGITPQAFKQINDGFNSVGIQMEWTKRRGVESALSIHVLSGLTGNMVRCQYKETDYVRKFEYLIQNKALLNQHYEEIKQKIAEKFQIESDQITIVEIEKGSVKTTFVVNLSAIQNKLDSKFMLNSQETLKIHPYFQKFKLSPEDFDPHGNDDYTKTQGLTQQQKFRRRQTERATFVYKKPLECKRYGLNVWDRYDKGNNDWLEYKNPNQWAIAYHGVSSPGNMSSLPGSQFIPQKDRPLVISSIMQKRLLKPGARDLYHTKPCFTPGHKKGCISPKNGIYLTPDSDVAFQYASPTQIPSGKKYRLAFQCRVQQKNIHIVQGPNGLFYYIAQSSQNIRPYAILLQQYK